jgi:outer membrane protein assembly factor BamB
MRSGADPTSGAACAHSPAPSSLSSTILVAVICPLLILSAFACGGDTYLDADPLAPIPTEVEEDEVLPPPLLPAWRATSLDEDGIPRVPSFRPAVGSDHVFLAYAGHVEARRASDGSESWRAELEATAAPVVQGQELIVASQGAIWWLAVQDGSFLGQFRMSQTPTFLAAAGGAVVFADGAALYQVDKDSQGWVVEALLATALVTNPSGDTVYVSTENGVLMAIDTASGTELWRYASTVRARLSAAAVSERLVYVAGNDQFLTAIDAQSGNQKWQRQLGVDAPGAPAVVGNIVYVAPLDSMLHGYEASNGTHLYNLSISARTYVDLVGYEPWVVVGPRYGPWLRARAPRVFTMRASLSSDTAAVGSDLRISPGVGLAGVALVNGDGTVTLLVPQAPR